VTAQKDSQQKPSPTSVV